MKKNNFEKDLLDNKIVDHRNLYVILVKKRSFIPSFSIMVMGLNKDELVFYKITTSYRLIKYVKSISLKNIEMLDINNKRSETILNIYLNKEKESYYVLEHNKDIYDIKKILKK